MIFEGPLQAGQFSVCMISVLLWGGFPVDGGGKGRQRCQLRDRTPCCVSVPVSPATSVIPSWAARDLPVLGQLLSLQLMVTLYLVVVTQRNWEDPTGCHLGLLCSPRSVSSHRKG